MNPLAWWLLAGGAGLVALGGAASRAPSAPFRVPSSAPHPTTHAAPAPPPKTKDVDFSQSNIDLAVTFALAHEGDPRNLQSFAAGLAEYGWKAQAAQLVAKAHALSRHHPSSHHHSGHGHG